MLSELGLAARGGDGAVTGLAIDSRKVKPGYLFAALPGTQVHGAEFIPYALRMDAGAVLTDPAGFEMAREVLTESDVEVVITENPAQALAGAAALWFGAQPETLVAITGTNGKTSVASFTRQIWQRLGLKAINVGTTGVQGDWTAPLAHTTPDPLTLQSALAEAAKAGVTHAALEASSHGLAQFRLDGVAVKAAGFTNLSQDHLDYHADFEDYFSAKASLFTRLLDEGQTAVINTGDVWGQRMARIAAEHGQQVIDIARNDPEALLSIEAQRFDATGQELRFRWEGQSHQARLDLIGGFQAENVLMAAALVIAAGVPADDVFRVLPELETVHGRMELAARRRNGASVFVDYAHTPAALETALKALRPHVMGRLLCVMGAGGDRDRGKRPLMGAAARDNADVVIVTDDNPRSEDPATIRAAVLAEVPEGIEVGDRAEAILRGVDLLEPGDALLIAGKGHETGQTVGDVVLPFDDVEQASVSARALDGDTV